MSLKNCDGMFILICPFLFNADKSPYNPQFIAKKSAKITITAPICQALREKFDSFNLPIPNIIANQRLKTRQNRVYQMPFGRVKLITNS